MQVIVDSYKDIFGWFDYEDVFDTSIKALFKRKNQRLKIVEIGAWLGKSSHYLVDNHNEKADIYIVDTWKGSPNELKTNHKRATECDLYKEFMKNMEVHVGKFTAIRSSSVDAANLFPDNSVDFIYIDADHRYESIKRDIEAWYPKLSQFGIIAGHDYHYSWPGVIRAVNEFFGVESIKLEGKSWIKNNSQFNDK